MPERLLVSGVVNYCAQSRYLAEVYVISFVRVATDLLRSDILKILLDAWPARNLLCAEGFGVQAAKHGPLGRRDRESQPVVGNQSRGLYFPVTSGISVTYQLIVSPAVCLPIFTVQWNSVYPFAVHPQYGPVEPVFQRVSRQSSGHIESSLPYSLSRIDFLLILNTLPGEGYSGKTRGSGSEPGLVRPPESDFRLI